jgi:hypothetical protein
MTATWTAPRTWVDGELVTASLLNAYLRDELDYLVTPALDGDTLNLGADPTFASTSFVSIDATNFKATVTLPAGFSRVALFLHLTWAHNTLGNQIYFDWLNSQTGARVAGDDGMSVQQCVVANAKTLFSNVFIVEGLTPLLTYTFTPQIKNSANTTTIYAGAGTANFDVHPQCYARVF